MLSGVLLFQSFMPSGAFALNEEQQSNIATETVNINSEISGSDISDFSVNSTQGITKVHVKGNGNVKLNEGDMLLDKDVAETSVGEITIKEGVNKIADFYAKGLNGDFAPIERKGDKLLFNPEEVSDVYVSFVTLELVDDTKTPFLQDGYEGVINLEPQISTFKDDYGTNWYREGHSAFGNKSPFSLFVFTDDGGTERIAFCMEHKHLAADNGTSYWVESSPAPAGVTEKCKKAIYYSLYGPGYGAYNFGALSGKGSADDKAVAVTASLLNNILGYPYYPNNDYVPENWVKTEDYSNWLDGQSLPSASLGLSDTSLTASITTINGKEMQKTNTTKVTGNSGNYITLKVPDKCYLYNTSTKATTNGGSTATIKVGESFYMYAPLDLGVFSYESGDLLGHTSTVADLKVLTPSTTNRQRMAMAIYGVPDNVKTSFSIKWLEQGKVTLKKVSANPDCTDGNSNYSVEGAKFGVYKEEACTTKVADLTTNDKGISNTVSLNTGTYYIKELVAPKGYYLSDEVKSVVVKAGGNHTVEFADVVLEYK